MTWIESWVNRYILYLWLITLYRVLSLESPRPYRFREFTSLQQWRWGTVHLTGCSVNTPHWPLCSVQFWPSRCYWRYESLKGPEFLHATAFQSTLYSIQFYLSSTFKNTHGHKTALQKSGFGFRFRSRMNKLEVKALKKNSLRSHEVGVACGCGLSTVSLDYHNKCSLKKYPVNFTNYLLFTDP